MWISIITLLIQLFGPLLVEWLRKRLDRAAADLAITRAGEPIGTPAAIDALFDHVEDGLPRLALVRRGFVAIVRRMVEKRANEIHEALYHGVAITPLTDRERGTLNTWNEYMPSTAA